MGQKEEGQVSVLEPLLQVGQQTAKHKKTQAGSLRQQGVLSRQMT